MQHATKLVGMKKQDKTRERQRKNPKTGDALDGPQINWISKVNQAKAS